MSKHRKISECINVRINVGNFQHIEITKYAEEEIVYNTTQEREDLENELTNDLVVGVIRSMKTIPEKLGKGVANAQEIEESISKAIPEWMDKKATPNIANNSNKAADHSNKVISGQKDNKDSAVKASEEVSEVLDVAPEISNELIKDNSDFDLFEDEEPEEKAEVLPEKVEEKAEEKVEVLSEENSLEEKAEVLPEKAEEETKVEPEVEPEVSNSNSEAEVLPFDVSDEADENKTSKETDNFDFFEDEDLDLFDE